MTERTDCGTGPSNQGHNGQNNEVHGQNNQVHGHQGGDDCNTPAPTTGGDGGGQSVVESNPCDYGGDYQHALIAVQVDVDVNVGIELGGILPCFDLPLCIDGDVNLQIA